MTDYKEKFQKAIKSLDESEREATDNIAALYKALLGMLNVVKTKHKLIAKAVAKLPKKVQPDKLPLVDLERIKDLLISHMGDSEEADSSLLVLEELLLHLSASSVFKDDVSSLQKMLSSAANSKDFINIAQKIATIVLDNNDTAGSLGNSSEESIEAIKDGLLAQLSELETSDTDIARSLDIVSLKEKLAKVTNLRSLEEFYKQIFEGFGEKLTKKDEFIVELSGLIETVVQQLSSISLEIKKENTNDEAVSKDRWRLTELMSEQVNTIRESVLQAESLSTLKELVSERMNVLNSNVNELVAIESRRVKDAEANTRLIENKLNKVQSEVSSLKSSLNKAHDQAFVDPLTGVANRRAYDERIKLEFERWKRNKEPLAIAIMDVDKFKKINDTFGHPVGDKVLRTISQLIHKKVRGSDFFGRVGGEEFVVIFAGSDLANIMTRLEQFRKSIEDCKFGSKGNRVVITMSVGCALFSNEDNPSNVYERADQALLKAKQTGRNKCLSDQDL